MQNPLEKATLESGKRGAGWDRRQAGSQRPRDTSRRTLSADGVLSPLRIRPYVVGCARSESVWLTCLLAGLATAGVCRRVSSDPKRF